MRFYAFPLKEGRKIKKVSFWNHTRIWPSRASPPPKKYFPTHSRRFHLQNRERFPPPFFPGIFIFSQRHLFTMIISQKTPPHKQQNSRKGEVFLRTVTTINFAHEKEKGKKEENFPLSIPRIYVLYIRTTTPFPFLKSGRNFFFFQEGETVACTTHRPFKSERRGGPSDKHLIPHLGQPTCLNYLFFLALPSSFHRGAITKRKGKEANPTQKRERENKNYIENYGF